MINRLWRLVRQVKHWRSPLVVLLCIGMLVCILVPVATIVSSNLQGPLQSASSSEDASILFVGSWEFASAHTNVRYFQLANQRWLGIRENALLLVAQYATPSLIIILPLLGLFSALALVRCGTAHAVSCILLGAAVPLVIGGFLLLESHTLDFQMSWAQWSRALVWLGLAGLYFWTFLSLGIWIGQRTRSTKTVTWIFLSLFVALFMIQSSRELLMRFDGSHLPPVPELPTEVRLSLFRPSGEPRVTLDREGMVADYLASVDAYSDSAHAVVAHRYGLERWWHIVSPQLLLNEISTQLLQTHYADSVDVIYSPGSRPPGLASSLAAVWPETAWLILLCGLAELGAWTATRKQTSS